MSAWDSLQRRAKYLETRLESKINAFSQLSHDINSNYSDAENQLDSKREQDYYSEIERDLNELAECVSSMRKTTPTIPEHQYESIVKRYHEIHFDHSSEFSNISASIQRKRDKDNLFGSKQGFRNEGKDDAMERLLGESNSIKSSLKSTSDVMGQAFEIKNSLLKQKDLIGNSTSGLTTITTNIPMIDRLIDGIQKKKAKESAIVAAVVGGLVCVTIWWVFLR